MAVRAVLVRETESTVEPEDVRRPVRPRPPVDSVRRHPGAAVADLAAERFRAYRAGDQAPWRAWSRP